MLNISQNDHFTWLIVETKLKTVPLNKSIEKSRQIPKTNLTATQKAINIGKELER